MAAPVTDDSAEALKPKFVASCVKFRKRKILYKCALGNTIMEVLNNREGWLQTTSVPGR